MSEALERYKRRAVIKSLGYAAVGVALGRNRGLSRALSTGEFVSKRPAVAQRKFVSEAIEGKTVEISAKDSFLTPAPIATTRKELL